MWVRQVDWEPDKLSRVFSQSFLFHPRDRMCRFFFTSCSEVHLGTAPHEMKCDVQTDTRAAIPKGWPSVAVRANTIDLAYFAPVTMATRPCKSSRSFPGEMIDPELPICTTAKHKGGRFVLQRRARMHLVALCFIDRKDHGKDCSDPR